MTLSQSPAFATPLSLTTSPTLRRALPKCPQRPAPAIQSRPKRATPTASQSPPEMPESAKQAVANGENVGYWQGEWICVDCGYVYKPGRRVKFEDLPSSWKCPQCNAPKRRFAKKAGDYIKETSGTSNLPIVIFSAVGLLATVAFGIWASANL